MLLDLEGHPLDVGVSSNEGSTLAILAVCGWLAEGHRSDRLWRHQIDYFGGAEMARQVQDGVTVAKGSCLCGAIRFEITGYIPCGSVCHCEQCRKQSGHAWASIHVAEAALKIDDMCALRWYSASPAARRGFCAECGSTLFWDPLDEDKISVSLGALDPPTGAKLTKHIFTAYKGDYYDIDDSLPRQAY